ncbi:MAG: phage major capsid protein [Alphaproteobacteria bacterium]|nr:phage major capsid protein [Alphaproteobacteria bacterium]
MDFDELKNVLEDGFVTVRKILDDERKEREALEMRINRLGIGTAAAGGVDKGELAKEHKALANFVRTGDEAGMKSMSVGSDPDGGYTVLPFMSLAMISRLFDQSPMRRLARIETIQSGDAFEEITDPNDVDAVWVGESQGRTATSTAQIGKIRIPLREIYANQQVTQRLLDDSMYDIGSWIDLKITDKFGRSEGSAFVNGDGVARPKGFLQYATAATADGTRSNNELQHVVTGHATAFLAPVAATGVSPADCLVDMVYALRSPYKQSGNVRWLMNSTTAATVRKFKDAQAQFVWADSIIEGQPPSLLGFPVELDENMPNVGAGTYPIAFGNWSLGYCIVDRPGIKMLRDPYTSRPSVNFYAYKRVGGDVANTDCIKLLKVST